MSPRSSGRRLFCFRWKLAFLILGSLVLGPFVISRLASFSRCVEIHHLERLAQATPQFEGPFVSEAAQQESQSSFQVVTYNIAHGRGLSESNWTGETDEERTQRLDAIAELLVQIDADVVVLNEVDFDTSWSGGIDQAQYIAGRCGYAYIAEQRNLDFRVLGWTWRFGNAVLSKHAIEAAEVVGLPGYAIWETIVAGKKRALDCQIKLDRHDDSGSIRIIAAHLSPRSENLRVRSMKQLLQLARESHSPTLIAGDLNSAPPGFQQSEHDAEGDNAIAVADASGLFVRRPIAESQLYQTYPAVSPDRVIDWVLAPQSGRIVHHRVIDTDLSDHRPVVLGLKFSPRDQKASP